MKTDLQNNFNTYIHECRVVSRLRPQTVKGYQEAFRNFTKLMPSITSTEQLTDAIMLDFFDKLQTRKRIVGKDTVKIGVKDSTIRTYWSKLNSFFTWLERKDIILRNPLTHLKPLQPEYNDKRELTKSDFQKIVSVVNLQYNNPFLLRRDLALLMTLYFCGLRKGEILGLQVRDIDLQKEIITLRGETSKSKRDRQIPISPIPRCTLKTTFQNAERMDTRQSTCLYQVIRISN